MNKDKNLIPELRFSEFKNKGEWDYKTIGEVFNSFSGGTPNTSEREYYGGKIPFIRSAEINKDETELFLTEEGLKNSSAKLVKKGDLLVALYGANSGDSAISKINGAINQAILCLQSDYSNTFTFNFLTLKRDWIVSRFIQGGQGNLSGDIIKSITIPFPQKQEQQKIASCLSSLDEVITAHTQKLDILKDHKKGLMQNLFPQADEKVPKHRFPEFKKDGDWKLIPIGKILEQAFRPIKMSDNKDYSLVTVKRRYGGVVSRGIFKGGSILVKSQFLIKENDFLISKRQIVHCACGVVPGDLKDSIVSNEYSVLVPTGENSIEFINFFSQQQIVGRSFVTCSIGVVIEKMLFKIDDWLKMEFLFPSPDEQRKIASCLSLSEALIKAQEEKIAQLKMHKKGLMQRLFPNMID